MSVRLFVALDLPESVVDALVAWRAPLLQEWGDPLRAVAPEALHVTLAFLGSKPDQAIAPLSELVATCVASRGGIAGLALGEPLWLPRRRPRVLAVALEDRHGALTELQARLVERLAADGWHQADAPSGRAYLPHVTVARARGRDGLSVPRGVEPAPPEPLVFDGAAVTLYRSHLDRAGARYEPLSVRRLA
jgi:2'-5' RNA ligase